jgi:hypothetical protein
VISGLVLHARGSTCVRFVRTKAEESACRGSDRARSRPVTVQVPPIVKMAIILAPRCGRFPWTLNHQGFAFDGWIQCWVRKSGCAWPEAIADDDDASLLWFFCEKQFSTKEPQESPLPKSHRKLQENHNVFDEYSRQNANAIDQFRPRTKDLHREAQIVEMAPMKNRSFPASRLF